MEFQGISFDVFDSVYEPSDDSFLLAEHSKSLKGEILEIGTGCGIVGILNAKNNPENKILAVDINPEAVKNAKSNAEKNEIQNIDFIQSNLFSKIPKRRFDAIIFNPPYLPTGKDEKINTNLNHAFDGGIDGRKVLDEFLDSFSGFLKSKGKLLILHSSLNNPEKTIRKLESMGFSVKILQEKHFFFETLSMIRADKKD